MLSSGWLAYSGSVRGVPASINNPPLFPPVPVSDDETTRRCALSTSLFIEHHLLLLLRETEQNVRSWKLPRKMESAGLKKKEEVGFLKRSHNWQEEEVSVSSPVSLKYHCLQIVHPNTVAPFHFFFFPPLLDFIVILT